MYAQQAAFKQHFSQLYQQFNDAVKMGFSSDTQDKILCEIRDGLPTTLPELKNAFKVMIGEGLIMNLSLLISRLGAEIQNPLLGNILWLLEDISGLSMEQEDRELLDCNIVARVIAIMETLVGCLSNCYLD